MSHPRNLSTPPTGIPKKRASFGSLVLLVVTVSAFFGFVALPQLDRARSLKQKLAPDFMLPVIYGGGEKSKLKLSDLRGRAVLLDFWASWCGPCREQMPAVNLIAQKYSKELVVVGINTGDEREKAVGLLQTLNLRYMSIEDEGGMVANSYGVATLPTLVIINREGVVKFFGTRVMTEQELAAELALAL
ncbi:MAG: TlpA disulfide reductase family protein [Polyangiaceae bacterium]|nr:TlpA disulfide reductase family protein [Polyangiaceae bacterium]